MTWRITLRSRTQKIASSNTPRATVRGNANSDRMSDNTSLTLRPAEGQKRRTISTAMARPAPRYRTRFHPAKTSRRASVYRASSSRSDFQVAGRKKRPTTIAANTIQPTYWGAVEGGYRRPPEAMKKKRGREAKSTPRRNVRARRKRIFGRFLATITLRAYSLKQE